MRMKPIPVLIAVTVMFAAFSALSAGEKEKAAGDKAKPVNPFLAAAGGKSGVEADKAVTLSNEDLAVMPAGEVPETPKPAAKKPGDEKLSFDNDDLKSMFGESPEPPEDGMDAAGTAEAPAGKDPMEWLEEQKAAAAAQAESADEARARVATAEARVKELEAKLLTLRNPLLSRRTAERGPDPDATEEEKAAYKSSGAADRVAMTEKELKEARAELADARAALAAAGGR